MGAPVAVADPAKDDFFDPKHYRIILLDQRGCERSKPQGSLVNNTTAHLVQDLEALRTHLNIDKWHVFGGSWGSTLALAYATQHSDKVLSLALRGIFLSRQSELDWFLGDIKHFYPEVWQTLLDYLPQDEQGDVLTAFEKRVSSDDINISHPASAAWNNYESSIMRLDPAQGQSAPAPSKSAEEVQAGKAADVSRARVQIHYIRNQCFIDGNAILKAAEQLSHIPTVIVQGRYDMVCPPQTAWLLSRAMPHAKHIIVQDAGHSAMEPGVISALGLFDNIPDKDNYIEALMQRYGITMNQHEHVFEIGNTDRSLYYLVSGEVHLTNEHGILRKVTANNYFGETASLTEQPTTTNAMVASPKAQIIVIHAENIDAMLTDNPKVAMHLLKQLAARIERSSH
ncbi:putative proline iminopeptidase [Nymphon striatum]|nr:putative proline iminopeptidase [Nymphon striatum]